MAYVAGNARRAGLTDLPKAAPLIFAAVAEKVRARVYPEANQLNDLPIRAFSQVDL